MGRKNAFFKALRLKNSSAKKKDKCTFQGFKTRKPSNTKKWLLVTMLVSAIV